SHDWKIGAQQEKGQGAEKARPLRGPGKVCGAGRLRPSWRGYAPRRIRTPSGSPPAPGREKDSCGDGDDADGLEQAERLAEEGYGEKRGEDRQQVEREAGGVGTDHGDA